MKTKNSLWTGRGFVKGSWLLVCFSLLSLIFLGASQAFSQERFGPQKTPRGIVPGRYIVTLNDYIQEPGAVAERLAKFHKFGLRQVYKRALKGFSAKMPETIVEYLKKDPDVAFVEPDRMVYAISQALPTGVDRIDADLNSIANIDNSDDRVPVNIAIIDSGIDLDHPDLNVVGSTDCARIWGGGCSDGRGNDRFWHGTHVAGIAAALDNDSGVVGVAPGAGLIAVRVLDNTGSGYLSWAIAGIDWVTAHADEIAVANMSMGWQGNSPAAHQAIKNSVAKGVVYVVAAGNDSKDVYGPDGVLGTADDFEPASYPEVATISALCDTDGKPGGNGGPGSYGGDDTFASFTNFSETVVTQNPVDSSGAAIDLVLPGVDILSTYLNGGYATASGTSMASPHAAGLAALYIAQNGRDTDGDGDHDAQDVYAIRQALIDNGVAQDDYQYGLEMPTSDPDGNAENLGWAGESGPITDIAITVVEMDSPDPVVQPEPVVISVTVKNVGNQEVYEAINVSLVDETPDNPIVVEDPNPQTIHGLAPGDSETLTFNCKTADASLGEHDLTASLQFGGDFTDDNSSNDTKSITVLVTDMAFPTSMRIADLDGSSRWYRRYWFFWTWEATVDIFVEDNLANAVDGATVNIRWSDGSKDQRTTQNGWCQFKGYQFQRTGSLKLTVESVSHPDLDYSSGENYDPDGDSDGTSITVNRP